MITDKDTILVFKVQKDFEGVSVLSFNEHIANDKFDLMMKEIEDDLLNILNKIENIIK